MKYLAVSGGIDSMVMMDFCVRQWPNSDWCAVTIDHGTRGSSAMDAEFVKREAEKRRVQCKVVRLELGENVSEAEARKARYEAFRRATEGKEIFVAHHLDDLVETVAINLLRGTGWRGLAAMRRGNVRRPFLEAGVDKKWIYAYAAKHGVPYRQDPTNHEDRYLRNRVRPLVMALPDATKKEIWQLWNEQIKLAQAIDKSVVKITTDWGRKIPRDMLTMMDMTTADEIARAWLLKNGVPTTRPQRADFLRALGYYQNGKKFNLPGDKLLEITREYGII